MASPKLLTLREISWADDQLVMAYDLDGLRFTNTIWYEDLSFDRLAERFGREEIERIAFHIAAFEINKVCSLKPKRLSWGPYERFADEAFGKIWRDIFVNVWAQWRYENDEPNYTGPAFETGASTGIQPIGDRPLDAGTLSFCGGGKDSLVAMKLLNDIGHPFGTLVYSASFYGQSKFQHDLISKLIDSYGVETRHRQWVFDDFLDSPVLEQRKEWGVEAVTAAETPSSIFGVLPYVLDRGYRYISLAHERSADAPQVVWEKTGEAVNHQWGKSFEAEEMLNRYVQQQLVRDFDYFSILKPVYDVAIFGLLRGSEEQIPHTHSCNISKPWCRRCPKCLYVWLGYAAFLDKDVVNATFGGENLFDVEENHFFLRQLVGLEDQLPFECIGEASEAALYMKMAYAKGWRGSAFDVCADAWKALDWRDVSERYLSRHFADANLPQEIAPPLRAILDENASETEAYIESVLS